MERTALRTPIYDKVQARNGTDFDDGLKFVRAQKKDSLYDCSSFCVPGVLGRSVDFNYFKSRFRDYNLPPLRGVPGIIIRIPGGILPT